MSKAYGGWPPTARELRTRSGRFAERLVHDDRRESLPQVFELVRVLFDHRWIDAPFLEDRPRIHQPLDPEQQLVDLVAWPPHVRPPDPRHVPHGEFLSSDVEL